MWRKQKQPAMMSLLMLVAVVLGFWSGYRLLPHSGLAQSPVFSGRLLYSALPFATALAEEAPEASLPKRTEPADIVSNLTPDLTPDMPDAINAQQAPDWPEKAAPRLILIDEGSIAAFAALNAAPLAVEPPTGEPRIAVYCTHSSEEYKNQARIPGARGGIHTVAQRLSEALNAAGLPTIYCDTVHDYPDWDLSYASSLASIQKLQQQYPSLDVFIDVHRDSLANSVLATGGGQVARIMLVVGSDSRLEHPDWQKNKAFAEQIQQMLEAATPGLTRNINVQKGRYNQHISTKAILVEMGSTANTVEEACKSAELLAAALAKLL